jgi:hypothetical protein
MDWRNEHFPRAAPALVGIILVAALAILIGWSLGIGEGEKICADHP